MQPFADTSLPSTAPDATLDKKVLSMEISGLVHRWWDSWIVPRLLHDASLSEALSVLALAVFPVVVEMLTSNSVHNEQKNDRGPFLFLKKCLKSVPNAPKALSDKQDPLSGEFTWDVLGASLLSDINCDSSTTLNVCELVEVVALGDEGVGTCVRSSNFSAACIECVRRILHRLEAVYSNRGREEEAMEDSETLQHTWEILKRLLHMIETLYTMSIMDIELLCSCRVSLEHLLDVHTGLILSSKNPMKFASLFGPLIGSALRLVQEVQSRCPDNWIGLIDALVIHQILDTSENALESSTALVHNVLSTAGGDSTTEARFASRFVQTMHTLSLMEDVQISSPVLQTLCSCMTVFKASGYLDADDVAIAGAMAYNFLSAVSFVSEAGARGYDSSTCSVVLHLLCLSTTPLDFFGQLNSCTHRYPFDNDIDRNLWGEVLSRILFRIGDTNALCADQINSICSSKTSSFAVSLTSFVTSEVLGMISCLACGTLTELSPKEMTLLLRVSNLVCSCNQTLNIPSDEQARIGTELLGALDSMSVMSQSFCIEEGALLDALGLIQMVGFGPEVNAVSCFLREALIPALERDCGMLCARLYHDNLVWEWLWRPFSSDTDCGSIEVAPEIVQMDLQRCLWELIFHSPSIVNDSTFDWLSSSPSAVIALVVGVL